MVPYAFYPSLTTNASGMTCYSNGPYVNFLQSNPHPSNLAGSSYNANFNTFGWWPPNGAPGSFGQAPPLGGQPQNFPRPRSARVPPAQSTLSQTTSQPQPSKQPSPNCSRASRIPSLSSEDQAERSLKRKLSTVLKEEQLQLLQSKTGEWTVICGEREWKVHGFIIEPRCQFFQAAAKFKQDGEEKVIDMSDDDPHSVEVLLQFLYARNSDDIGTTAPFTETPAQTLANIAIIGDKYNEQHLVEQAEIEVFRLVRAGQYLGLEDAPSRARDALKALSRLHEHGAVSRPLQRLQLIMLKFLRDTDQLKVMDGELLELFEDEVASNPSLATMMVRFLSGGQCFGIDAPKQKTEIIDLRSA